MVVEFRHHLSYLELRFLKTRHCVDLRVLTMCRQQLYDALLQVSSKFPCMKFDGLQWGFYCPGGLQPGGQPHPAVCQPITCPPEELPFDMDCSNDPCEGLVFKLEYKHKIWFKVSSLKYVVLHAKDCILDVWIDSVVWFQKHFCSVSAMVFVVFTRCEMQTVEPC